MAFAFQLKSLNLTQVGGPMGTDMVTENFSRLYSSAEKAKKAAEKDYGKKIEWNRYGFEGYNSPDLLHVMYEIRKLTIL